MPMIPEDAVLQRSDGAVVFRLVGEDRVERRVLRTGVFREGRVEVIDGLALGDRVVVRGQHGAWSTDRVVAAHSATGAPPRPMSRDNRPRPPIAAQGHRRSDGEGGTR